MSETLQINKPDRLRFISQNPITSEVTPEELAQVETALATPKTRKPVIKSDSERAKLVGNTAIDVNALLPLKFPIFREFWRTGQNNNWIPVDIPMSDDIATWNKVPGTPGALSEGERKMVLINLGFFSPAESLIGNNVALALYRYVNDPAARQALGRLFFEETIHNETFMYIVESLGLNEKEIYSMYHTNPIIAEKCAFMQEATSALVEEKIDVQSLEGRQTFMEALLAQMIMEGILFYSGFVMNLSLYRRNLMKGIGKQYAYIMRDESLHIEIIRTIFNHLKNVEWPEIWTEDFQKFTVEKVKEAVAIETQYAEMCLPKGIMGLKAEMFAEYVRYLADRRLEFIGMKKIYNATNPFPWLSEVVDLSVETNFFEGRVTEYQAGGLSF